jgi:hypothetical protein
MMIIPDDGGSTYLWNVGRQLFYTAVHPRRQFWTINCWLEFSRVGVALSINGRCFLTKYLVNNIKRVKCKRKVTDRKLCNVSTKPILVATQSWPMFVGTSPARGMEVYWRSMLHCDIWSLTMNWSSVQGILLFFMSQKNVCINRLKRDVNYSLCPKSVTLYFVFI